MAYIPRSGCICPHVFAIEMRQWRRDWEETKEAPYLWRVFPAFCRGLWSSLGESPKQRLGHSFTRRLL
jgi:hypothetical protein